MLAPAIRAHTRVSERLRAEFPGAESERDLLLVLALARVEGRGLTVTGAGFSAGLPGTTAIHAIRRLTAARLVYRIADASDQRISWLHITDAAFARVEAVFAQELRKVA
jgi:DNA-binding MarR family transcriptional regulator